MSRFEVTIVCTDRGQHPWTLLGTVTRTGEPLDGRFVTNLGIEGNESKTRLVTDVLHTDGVRLTKAGGLRMRCRRCHRDVPLTRETALKTIAAVERADMTELDLSAIP